MVLSHFPYFADLALPDQLRLTAFEAEDRRLPQPMLDAIQRAADLLEPNQLPPARRGGTEC